MVKSRLPKTLTEDTVDALVEDLVSAKECAIARSFLEKRGLWSEPFVNRFDVGAVGGVIVFVQRDANGQLTGRYRIFTCGAPKNEAWGWRGAGPTQGLWPWIPAPEGRRVWIVEGEWDCWTGWVRLDAEDANLHFATMVGGASVSMHPSQVPTWLARRRVDLCYDNDVYQGPRWQDHRAPGEKQMAGMRQRRSALIRTGRALATHGCDVWMRAVPVDPLKTWGGDLRDWVDAGGRNLDEVPAASLEEVLDGERVILDRKSVAEVSLEAGNSVRFRGTVTAVEEDGIVWPRRAEIDCEMGTKPYCADCRGPQVAPEKVIDFNEYPELLAEAMAAPNFEQYVVKNHIGKPGRCPRCRVTVSEYCTACRWGAGNSSDNSEREVTVISKDPPNLSGETEIEGSVYHVNAQLRVVVMARRTSHVDRPVPDMATNLPLIRELSPQARPTAADIEAAMHARADFLAADVTRVFGRSRLHTVIDLLYHSVLWFQHDGHKRRGWLDVCVIGDTGSGKSSTAKRIIEWLELGQLHACIENVSRAGLTMGAVRVAGGALRQRPGLLPRLHGKLLALDEFHIMVEERAGQENPMLHLQGARDLGQVEGVKVYGARRLDAAVRLLTIANWLNGRASSYKHKCEHVAVLYGRPEVLRRLDLALTIEGEPNLDPPMGVMPWTKPAFRALILRAWAMTEAQVVIEDDAVTHAKQTCDVWKDRYSEEMSLFTLAEKPLSILRVAIAAACACFSHPEGDSAKCLVTREHVEWARQLFEELWREAGYEHYSAGQMRLRHIEKPFSVERLLTVELGLFDATDALYLLNRFFAPMSKTEMTTYLGRSVQETEGWANRMVRAGALEPVMARNAYHREWRLTPGAFVLLQNLVMLATEHPDRYAMRVSQLDQWRSSPSGSEPNMVSLTMPEAAVRAAYE